MLSLLSPIVLAVILLLIFLVILWTFLPFAIFGTKPLLSQLIELQKANNDLLRKLQEEVR